MAQFALADELGDFLGRSLEPDEVTQADLLLQLASAAIQSEAHQSLEFVEDDEVPLRGSYAGQMWLPERPVLDVSEVTIANGVGLPLSLPLTTTQFVWARRGLLKRGAWTGGEGVESNADVPWGGWGGPNATVIVTYSHGYESIPDDIKGVCLSAASRAIASGWYAAHGLPADVQSETTDGYSVVYGGGRGTTTMAAAVALAEDEARLIRRYRPVNA